jgi:alpha-glucosidase (family GH31 glycosyl hydrolase)
VKPVTAPSTTAVNVYLPGDAESIWYPFKGGQPSTKPSSGIRGLWSRLTRKAAAPTGKGLALSGGAQHPAEAEIDQGVPVYQRGGTIVPTRERARRSTASMKADPYTLHVALDAKGSAAGQLYMDDGDTEAYEQGAFLKVSLHKDTLRRPVLLSFSHLFARSRSRMGSHSPWRRLSA